MALPSGRRETTASEGSEGARVPRERALRGHVANGMPLTCAGRGQPDGVPEEAGVRLNGGLGSSTLVAPSQ